MPKSADAFRTISEVSDWLETPAHVLRFWESKFSQVKPVKRAGGRRYYRPADMLLLGGIKKLLHEDGMTIKGVQKVLREQGIKHVASLSQPLDEEVEAADSGITLDAKPAEPDSATVVDFKSSSKKEDIAPSALPTDAEKAPDTPSEASPALAGDDATPPPSEAPDTLAADAPDVLTVDDSAAPAPTQAPDTLAGGVPDGVEDTVLNALADTDEISEPADTTDTGETEPEQGEAPAEPVMPSFLRHRETEASPDDAPTPTGEDTATADHAPETLTAPSQIEIPDDPGDDLAAANGFLAHLLDHKGPLSPEIAQELAPLMDRLRALKGEASAKG